MLNIAVLGISEISPDSPDNYSPAYSGI